MSQGTIYAYTTPAYERAPWSGHRRGRGLIKVGFTTRDAHTRIREQIGASSPERDPYTLLLSVPAMTSSGSPISDHQVHKELERMGVNRLRGEWFECSISEVSKALSRLQARRASGRSGPSRKRSKKKFFGRRSRRGSSKTRGFVVLFGLAIFFFPDQTLSIMSWFASIFGMIF